jgi:hypothetical protein
MGLCGTNFQVGQVEHWYLWKMPFSTVLKRKQSSKVNNYGLMRYIVLAIGSQTAKERNEWAGRKLQKPNSCMHAWRCFVVLKSLSVHLHRFSWNCVDSSPLIGTIWHSITNFEFHTHSATHPVGIFFFQRYSVEHWNDDQSKRLPIEKYISNSTTFLPHK